MIIRNIERSMVQSQNCEKMENSEIINFVKVWFSILACLWYCYSIGKAVPKGTKRLICLLPIISIFLYLPLHLFVIHLRGPTAFFISWLANFKLLLYAFDKGPLSSVSSNSTLARFVAVACLPIKIQQNPSPPQSHNKHGQKLDQDGKKSSLNYGIKTLLLALLVNIHDYSDYIHPNLVSFLYCLYLYIQLEIILAIAAAAARLLLKVELEPQFNEPYLSTSLQDFWGRRWNLMVSSILRPAVYEPVRDIASGVVGRKWASIPAVMGTFLVSGIMHELMFFYLGREKPTVEMTSFFLLHGLCLVIEVNLKKSFGGRWKLPWLISGPLTIGFVMLTGFWLFLPSLYNCRVFEKASMEYAALVAFVESVTRRL